MAAVLSTISPFTQRLPPGPGSCLVAPPISRFQICCDPHLIGPCPSRQLNAKSAFEDFADRDIDQWISPLDLLIAPIVKASIPVIDVPPLVDEPAVDTRVPGIRVVTLVLFGFSGGDQFRLVEPPDGAFSV